MRKLSVVTPVLDRAETIGRALESVARLRRVTDWEIEHLVMDGGSTDGTLEVAGRFEVEVFSQADRSLYEAINRGVAKATGAYVCLLNSDDELLPVQLERLLRFMDRAGDPEAVWAGAETVQGDEPDGHEREVYPARAHGPLSALRVMMGAPIINARIFRRDVYERVGPFDPSLRIAADREFLIRVVQAGVTGVVFEAPVYRYHVHEGSLTMQAKRAKRETLEEYLRIAEGYAQDERAPMTVRGSARAWRAWTRFLLDAPADSSSAGHLTGWQPWRDAPSKGALLGAVLAKTWLEVSAGVRSMFAQAP